MARTPPRSRRTSTDVRGSSRARGPIGASGLAFCLALVSSGTSAQAPTAMRIEAPACTPGWYDEDAFVSALSAELALDEVRIETDAALALVIEVSCEDDAEAALTLVLGPERREVSLLDVAPGVRMRALALAARDFAAVVRSRRTRATPSAPPIAREPTRDVEDAERLASPRAPAAREIAPPTPPLGLALEVSARATWLGLRLGASSLSVEAQARFAETPLALWIALDGLYAVGTDALGEVRAFDVGGRAGARLVLDVDAFTFSLSVGALAAYARAEGVPPGGVFRRSLGIHGGALDAPLIGIDVALAASIPLGGATALTISAGALGYVLGFEARAEDRAIVSFRDVAPWVALGLRFAL